MSKKIIKYLKNSIDEKGNYCYSLPVETTKAVIKELNRLNNIINELEKYIKGNSIYYNTSDGCQWVNQFKVLDKLKALKEDNK